MNKIRKVFLYVGVMVLSLSITISIFADCTITVTQFNANPVQQCNTNQGKVVINFLSPTLITYAQIYVTNVQDACDIIQTNINGQNSKALGKGEGISYTLTSSDYENGSFSFSVSCIGVTPNERGFGQHCWLANCGSANYIVQVSTNYKL